MSHDINADPEVWELTDICGDRALRVWLECLSIADRNSGKIGKESPYLHKILATKCRLRSNKVATILQLSCNKGWTKLDDSGYLYIAKWAKYNKIRDTKKLLSEPSEPSYPNKSTKTPATPTLKEHILEDPKEKKKAQVERVFAMAKEIAGSDKQRGRELCTFVAKTVKEGVRFGDSDEVINDAIIYTLESLRAKAIKEGHQIDKGLLWPYLQKTYTFKRTKALETESDRYKREPLQSTANILKAVMGDMT